MSTNDNEPGAQAQMLRTSEAHGQAALILVESLIHGLITKSVITTEDSLDIVTSAVDVQADYAAEAVDGLAHEMHHAQVLLTTIADSLRTDFTGSAPHPTRPTLVDLHASLGETPGPPIDPHHDVDGYAE